MEAPDRRGSRGGCFDGTAGPHPSEPERFVALVPLDTVATGDDRPSRLDPLGADLSLFASGLAPVLADHGTGLGDVLGRVHEAWIEDATLAAVFSLAPTRKAREAGRMIRAGYLSAISIGGRFAPADASGRIAWWRPHELSLAAVPRIWGSRASPLDLARPVVERRLAAIRATAGGTAATWQAWPNRAAPDLAAGLGVAPEAAVWLLAEAVRDELDRLGALAEAEARARLGLGAST